MSIFSCTPPSPGQWKMEKMRGEFFLLRTSAPSCQFSEHDSQKLNGRNADVMHSLCAPDLEMVNKLSEGEGIDHFPMLKGKFTSKTVTTRSIYPSEFHVYFSMHPISVRYSDHSTWRVISGKKMIQTFERMGIFLSIRRSIRYTVSGPTRLCRRFLAAGFRDNAHGTRVRSSPHTLQHRLEC